MNFIDPSQDPWRAVAAESDLASLPPSALLSLPHWQAVRTAVPPTQRVGVLLPNDADPADLRDDLPRLTLVALDFPKWTDGRAYSQARLLRTRSGFTGEIRAVGDVLVDMLPLLQRSGFDAVVLKSGQSLEAARRALGFFAAHYQRDAIGGVPVFSPRHLAHTRATIG